MSNENEVATSSPKTKLWTRDFTILSIGSFISMLGNAVCGYAFSLMVYNETQSTFLFALMMVSNLLPSIVFPTFAGAFFDRRSRRKAIYILDFATAALFICIAALQYLQVYNYWLYILFTLTMGTIGSFYTVAFESYFPNVISKGNYSKAYSISSLLYPVATVITMPIVGVVYGLVGAAPMFAFSAVMFAITAVFELFIRAPEPHLLLSKEELSLKKRGNPFKQFATDLKFGFKYLNGERGLKTIASYFFFTMGTGAVLSALFLPFITKTFSGETTVSLFFFTVNMNPAIIYGILTGANTLGRLVGGLLHYYIKIPAKVKFNIAITVYVSITVLDMFVLMLPAWWMMCIFQVMVGMLAVNSYNIRISSTQNYVPDTVRARYNGVFTFITMLGTVIGQLAGGALGEMFDARYIVAIAMAINLASIFMIMFTNREHVKKIYNVEQI